MKDELREGKDDYLTIVKYLLIFGAALAKLLTAKLNSTADGKKVTLSKKRKAADQG